MKKLAICMFVLALAAVMVPTSQAAPRCMTLQDFCDAISFDTANIGGQTGTELWGDWNWDCAGTLTFTAGNGGSKFKFGTRPVYSNGVAFGLTSNWTMTKGNKLGDIIFSAGLGGGIAFAIQNEPWFQANGSCASAKQKSAKLPLIQSLSR